MSALRLHRKDDILGSSYDTWLRLQVQKSKTGKEVDGQQRLKRFHRFFTSPCGRKMRRQSGHQHRCSVAELAKYVLFSIWPYCKKLNVGLVTIGFELHDEPEGILNLDVPAPDKTDHDDLAEYIIFRDLYHRMGGTVWKNLQKAYLLQHCLKNPSCFPPDACKVMTWLAKHRRCEAVAFQEIQQLDYFYYAYECWRERGIRKVIEEVSAGHIGNINALAGELPGFRETVWTDKIRGFFQIFADRANARKQHRRTRRSYSRVAAR